jgi:hypothetical protein
MPRLEVDLDLVFPDHVAARCAAAAHQRSHLAHLKKQGFRAPCVGPPAQQQERFFVRVARDARLSKRQHGDGPQNGGAAVAEVMEFE